MIAEFKEITGANLADSTRFIKKYKSLETVCLLLLHEGNELTRRQLMHSLMILKLRVLLLQKEIKLRKRN
jgi:hypothetical protein